MANEQITRNEQPDQTPPSNRRQAELKTEREENIKAGKSPYQGVQIRTIGELFWIMDQERWSGAYNLPTGFARINLSGSYLLGINLRNAYLCDANLSGTHLYGADLSGAHLPVANLSEASIQEAFLSGAHLGGANLRGSHLDKAILNGAYLSSADLGGTHLKEVSLSGADLKEANLSSADLTSSDLSDARLQEANLQGANLTRAMLSAKTTLDGIKLDENTRLLGVRWNGAPLDAIKWRQAPLLGEETALRGIHQKNRQERFIAYQDAQRAYHGLSLALRDQGLTNIASHYRLHELAMQRKAFRAERNYGGWLLNVVLGAVAGNGERPGRAFVAYLSIVALFAAVYWSVTNFLHTSTPHLQWYEAIVLSLTSFHGRGFFPGTIQLGDPLAIVAALEAVSGLFIELIFIATFSRRFLGE